MRFTSSQLREIANRLEHHDAVFSQLWQISTCVFDTTIKTAAVGFDPTGQVVCLYVNPEFWQTLSLAKKDFVICHEMLHVLLEHGRRAKDADKNNPDAPNIAMDLVVNHLLVTRFGFSRAEVDPMNTLCWVDTIFSKRQAKKLVDVEGTFEYFFNLLPKITLASSGAGLLDDHSRLGDGDLSKAIDHIASKLSEEEKDNFLRKIGIDAPSGDPGGGRGDTAGTVTKTLSAKRIPKKKKWEALIKTCMKKMIADGVEDSWFALASRRHSILANSKIILPAEISGENTDKNRALVYFFLDTSGSCSHLAERFWKLASSVPLDVFDLRLRCFDTEVYKVDINKKELYGFGGTSFDILEKHIQQEMQKGKYPDGVFVVTDGYGNQVDPAKPSRWHVLLTGNSRQCFPKTVNFHQLSKFE